MHKSGEKSQRKRKNSPDDLSLSFEKLNMMQENLRLASDTIDALKTERDRLVQLVHTPDSKDKHKNKLDDSLKKQALKEELVSLRVLSMRKDKTIETLQRKLKEQNSNNFEIHSLHENNSKLHTELSKKEKSIMNLQDKLKELSLVEENYQKVSKLNENLNKEVKDLNQKIQELTKSKVDWKEIFDLTNSMFSEYFIYNKGSEIGKNDWEIFIERMKIIKNLLNDSRRFSETKDKKDKDKNSELQDLESMNKKLKKELELITKSQVDSNTFFEIQECAVELIEFSHNSLPLHKLFKKSFVCSKSFKNLIDRYLYDEALLRTLKFALSLLEDLNFYTFKESSKQDSPKSILRATPKSVKNQQGKRFNFVEDPSEMQEELFKPSCWTQTHGSLSKSTFQPKHSKTLSQISQLSQSKHFPNSILKDHESPNKNRSIQVPNPPKPGQISKPSHRLKTSSLSQEGFTKLADESQQLLHMIDKQNSRLAKINTQISQLVPNSTDNDSASSFVIDTSQTSSQEGRSFYKFPINKRTIWDEEESIIVHSQSGKDLERKSKACQISKPLTDSIRLRSPPQAHPPEERPKLEKHLKTESLNDELYNCDEVLMHSNNSSPRREKKRSAWDLTAVHVPPLDDKKKASLYDRKISPREAKPVRKRSKSPEANLDRFNEYTRPTFKGERKWNGVGEFFSASTEENKNE